jgi:hypothetical protein
MSYLDDEIALEKIREEVRQGKDPRYSHDSDISHYYLRLKDREYDRIHKEIEADRNKHYQNKNQEVGRKKAEDQAKSEKLERDIHERDRYYNQPEIYGTKKWESEYAIPIIAAKLIWRQEDPQQLPENLRDYYFKNKLLIDRELAKEASQAESLRREYQPAQEESEAEYAKYIIEQERKKEKEKQKNKSQALIFLIACNLFALFIATALPMPLGIILWLIIGLPPIIGHFQGQ